MAADPKESESNGCIFRPHGPMGLSFAAGQSKKSTSSKANSELQIRRENHVKRAANPVSRRRALNLVIYEMIFRRKLSISGEAFTTAAARSRTTARRCSENDLFHTKNRVLRSTVAKR